MSTSNNAAYPQPPTITFPTEPKIFAYEDSPDCFRVRRVRAALAAMVGAIELQSEEKAEQFNHAIIALHDRKGSLEILWRSPLDFRTFEQFATNAWQLHGECNLGHNFQK